MNLHLILNKCQEEILEAASKEFLIDNTKLHKAWTDVTVNEVQSFIWILLTGSEPRDPVLSPSRKSLRANFLKVSKEEQRTIWIFSQNLRKILILKFRKSMTTKLQTQMYLALEKTSHCQSRKWNCQTRNNLMKYSSFRFQTPTIELTREDNSTPDQGYSSTLSFRSITPGRRKFSYIIWFLTISGVSLLDKTRRTTFPLLCSRPGSACDKMILGVDGAVAHRKVSGMSRKSCEDILQPRKLSSDDMRSSSSSLHQLAGIPSGLLNVVFFPNDTFSSVRNLKIKFFTKSLPCKDFQWHCRSLCGV